jgi:hypothetical protein
MRRDPDEYERFLDSLSEVAVRRPHAAVIAAFNAFYWLPIRGESLPADVK